MAQYQPIIDTVCALVEQALNDAPEWAELLLFVDQFEELFTVVSPEHITPFVELLAAAAECERLRTVLTLRADFYHRCVEYPQLADLLRTGSFPLAAPELDALLAMIERPAVVAGLEFDEGLPGRMLRDTGQEPGAVALMAYTLDELYKLAEARGDRCLTFDDYTEKLGGVQGAIGTRAENVSAELDDDAQNALPDIFRELVGVDERGTATRQRAPLARITGTGAEARLVAALTDARLLVQSHGGDNRPVVEVAHEALFRSWPRLAEWIETAQDDLRLLRQVRQAAKEWHEKERDSAFLWPDERLQPVYTMLERLQPDLDAVTQDFIRPEAEWLIAELEDIDTPHQKRMSIGERLALIGDPRPGVSLRPDGLPDIRWCTVLGGEVTLTERYRSGDEKELGTFTVDSFYIAEYPVTYVQFQAFVEADDGFQNPRWWEGLAATEKHRSRPGEQKFKSANNPRETVSWYDAVAFCRWLNTRLPPDGWPEVFDGWDIRLPTEWEWQQAATGGKPECVYPWGPDWEEGRRCNTRKSGLLRTTAVGIYPHNVSPFGVLDMSGNVSEWCLNKKLKPLSTKLNAAIARVLRGGSWYSSENFARSAARNGHPASNRAHTYGFRVVCSVSMK